MHGPEMRELDPLDEVLVGPPVVAHELCHAGPGEEGLQPGVVGGVADEEADVDVGAFVAGAGEDEGAELRGCGETEGGEGRGGGGFVV